MDFGTITNDLFSIWFSNLPIFSFSSLQIQRYLFSRVGLLPVLVLLLYNPDYHRFRGLCGSSTGAQLDKKSWLCCHQVCSWWGQRVQLILEINISSAIPFVDLFPGSFCFLLWGLSAVASSVNLLVLKFMTISLEEVSSSVRWVQKGRKRPE